MLTSIKLRIHGDLLDPEEITAILKISPHIFRRKGDVRVCASQKEVASKLGIWVWQSNDPSETFTINDHISRLRATFAPVYSLLPNLPNTDYAWVDVYIAVGENDGSTSSVWFDMNVESISTLREIGLPVEFTVDTVSSPEQA